MSSRARTVAYGVSQKGWDEFRISCEDSLAAARRLWSESKNLVIEAAEVEMDGDLELLADCRRLLAACDCLVASEEEILELNDLSALSAETYVDAS